MFNLRKYVLLLVLLGLLEGCANTQTPDSVQTNAASPAVTNTSYMFRGPPQSVAGALRGGGHGR